MSTQGQENLQQMFRKQGIGRQAELVRRVLSIQTLARDVRSEELPR